MRITITKGNKLMILPKPFSIMTFVTIANTQNGVSFTTKPIKAKIALLIVSTIDLSSSTFLVDFAEISTNTPKIIQVETICMALNSTKACIKLLGMRPRIKLENVSDWSSPGWKEVHILNSAIAHGCKIFISKSDRPIARVVVII